MSKDTSYPMRILTALKGLNWKFVLNNRGEAGVPPTQDPPTQDPPPTPPADWRVTQLPDDIKNDPIFAKYKEPADAMRALVDAQKFLGREKLPVPKDANDTETVNLILKRLGLPESDAGYELPTDIQIPKEIPFDDTLVAGFKKEAHSLGILPAQFKGLYKWYMNTLINQHKNYQEQQNNAYDQAETALRSKWGAAYVQNTELAKKVFAHFGGEEAIAEFNKGLGNNPVILELFANIGKVLSEDQLSGKPKGIELTPAEAQAELSKIKGDQNHAYWKVEDPNHKEAVEYVTRLMKLIG